MVFPIVLEPDAIVELMASYWGVGALVGTVIALLSAAYRRG
jgi:hypothetical protein